jgi:predicted DCC family thiol-disulfide oxidoreductase YuxK
MKLKAPPQQPLGWILYDDSCGFCRRWIPFWEGALQRRGFLIAPLQADWVRERLQLSASELLHDLRLLLADGSQIRGADVYRYATRRIWWAWPVSLLSITPGLRNVFDWGYRTFAKNRFRVSAACGLDIKN